MTTTTSGYEPMRSGEQILFYINRDGLPLSDRCTERMWTFCMEQYPKSRYLISNQCRLPLKRVLFFVQFIIASFEPKRQIERSNAFYFDVNRLTREQM